MSDAAATCPPSDLSACFAHPMAAAASGVSPLMLSHQLLALAEHADRAGLPRSATRLLELAHDVCSERRPVATRTRRAFRVC